MNTLDPINVLFQAHEVRFVQIDGKPHVVGKDACEVLGLKNHNDAMRDLPERWKMEVEVCGVAKDDPTSRARKTQRMVVLTISAVLELVLKSRKPEAVAFKVWLLEEVLPQLLKYGYYVTGSTAADRCSRLWWLYKEERAREIADAQTRLTERALMTVSQFRELHEIAGRDILSFSRIAAQVRLERQELEQRVRVFTHRGMRSAYSLDTLLEAKRRLQPQLPFDATLTGGAK